MRRTLVVGNWKMHGSKALIGTLLRGIEERLVEVPESVDIGVCPTHLHMALAAETLTSDRIKLGAQDAFAEPEGAFTGEVSASMLAEYGVTYVIVGHSERRTLFAETNEQVAAKFLAVQQNGLVPVLCVGETLQQRQQGATDSVVLEQLDAVIAAAGIAAMGTAVLAYEPIWAIGTGETASPEQAQSVHRMLRKHLAAQSDPIAAATRIIYGGSVKGANAKDLFEQADIDGGLIGGASLQAEEFISICKSAD